MDFGIDKIICQNSFGNSITFSDSFPYFLEKVEGLYEKSSELFGSKSAFGIGELYTGRSVNKRNIVLYGYFKDHFVERRDYLYNMFPDEDEGTLFYYEDNKKLKIKYQVEKVSITEIVPIRYFMISLICFNPYFEDIEETQLNLASITGGIEFPLEIPEDGMEFETKSSVTSVQVENPTKIECGLRIVFSALGPVKNPTLKNIINQEEITTEFDMKLGDKIVITTHMNNKNIVLIRNGVETNINNYLKYGTRFLQLKPGTNHFKVLADEGTDNLTTDIFYTLYYEAV